MPKIDNIEETPNPNAVKFVLKEPVSNGAARSYRNAEEGKDDPTGIQRASKVRSTDALMAHCWGKLAVAYFLLVFYY